MNIPNSITNLRNRYSQSNREAFRNPWVIGWLAVIVVFLTVNILFFIVAVLSSPGLVVEDYYEQGRRYEQNALKIQAERQELQWEVKFEIPESIIQNEPDVFRFSAADSRGLPIKNAAVQLLAYRPSDANADFTLPLEQIAPGLYQSQVSFPLPGVWDVRVKVQQFDDHLEMSQRISVLTP